MEPLGTRNSNQDTGSLLSGGTGGSGFPAWHGGPSVQTYAAILQGTEI